MPMDLGPCPHVNYCPRVHRVDYGQNASLAGKEVILVVLVFVFNEALI